MTALHFQGEYWIGDDENNKEEIDDDSDDNDDDYNVKDNVGGHEWKNMRKRMQVMKNPFLPSWWVPLHDYWALPEKNEKMGFMRRWKKIQGTTKIPW